MERLISSSTSLSSGASISKHRFLVPGSSSSAYLAGISAARSGLLFLRRSGFKPVGAVLSNYDEPHRPRVFRSLSCLGNYAVPILEGKGGQNSLDAQSETGRDLTGVFLRKQGNILPCLVADFCTKKCGWTGWKARLLSFAGRLQFIKYTITNVIAYWMRSAILPKTICKALNKLCAKFLYFGSQNPSRLHLISWDKTCKPISLGGLGIASLLALRYAFNCSTILRMYNSTSPLPCWLKTRYTSPWKIGHCNATPFWKSICYTANLAQHKFKFHISQNSPIAISWDHWSANESLSSSISAFVSSYCNSNVVLGDWMHLTNWVLPPNLGIHLTEFITALPISSTGNKHITWDNSDNANFKDFYLDYFANDSTVDWYLSVWHKNFALRYSVYSWMAFSGGLKTVEVLLLRNINIVDLLCPLCHDFNETTNHLFFECLYSFNVLTRLMPTFRNFLLHPNIYQAFEHVSALETASNVKNGILLLLNATVYYLWMERNNRRFNSKFLCASTLAKHISRAVASTAFSVVLSVVAVTVIQTILARPVYATVQAAAQTGGRLFRTEFLSSAWTGFFAGCLHTLSGPDHLAALAPLSIGRTRIESAIVGALWGCGHDAGQMIFGLLFLLLKDRLRIEVIRTWGTRVVGITLLIIGAMGIKEASEVATPCVAHENGECDVSIVETLESTSSARKKIGFATFATGIVHGLQPDALMMILPALALPSRLAGAAFLGMFLVGTVFAMGTYTVFIGSCSQALKGRVPRITEKLTWAASLLAIFMGLAILISQLFGFSLY
ncbi:hypothetical protein M5K25_016714 [Dendrobium thyrsiflorum]|uniref:Reverse transcriptase zinc-binding domain-containing protein n=1 Tax=Dendrobium thyrsiflorum TaxID=117978 RepID=A0ABD0US92_DENTH